MKTISDVLNEKMTMFERIPVEYLNLNNDTVVSQVSDVKLPQRATKNSAGYDFYMPYPCQIQPGESVVINTYVRCRISSPFFLALFPKSGLGFKYHVSLANTVGIVDSDYYNNPSNGGHIMVKLVNNGDKTLSLLKGDKFCQGIFMPYGITSDDNPCDAKRTGGFGSTGR